MVTIVYFFITPDASKMIRVMEIARILFSHQHKREITMAVTPTYPANPWHLGICLTRCTGSRRPPFWKGPKSLGAERSPRHAVGNDWCPARSHQRLFRLAFLAMWCSLMKSAINEKTDAQKKPDAWCAGLWVWGDCLTFFWGLGKALFTVECFSQSQSEREAGNQWKGT